MIAPKTEFKTIGFKQRRKTALICFFAVLLAFVFSAISCGVLPREELYSGLTASTGFNSEPYVSEETDILSKTVTTDKKTVTETADNQPQTVEIIDLGEEFLKVRMAEYFEKCSCLEDFLYYLSESNYDRFSNLLSVASYFSCEEYSAIRLKFSYSTSEHMLVENYIERTFSIYEIFDSGVVRDTDFYNTENIGVKMKKPLKNSANYSSSKRSFSHLSKGESVDFSAISSGGAIDGYLSVKSAYSAKVLKEKTLYSGIACFESSADTVPYYRMPDNSDIIRIFDIITAEKPALMTLKDYDYTDGAVKLYELGFLFSEAARFPTAELSIWECPGSDGRVIVSLTDYGERLLTKEESAEIRAIYAKAHEAAKSNNETFFNHKSQQHRLLPDGIISLSHGKYDIGFYAFTSDLISPTFCTIIPGCPEETSQKLFCFGNKYDFFISRDDGNTDIPKCSLYLTKGIYCNYLFNGYTPKEAVVKIVTGKFEVLSAEQKSPTQFLLTLSDNSEYDYAVCRVNGFISDYGCLLPPYPLSWTKEDVFVVLLMKDVSREEALKAAEGSSFEY